MISNTNYQQIHIEQVKDLRQTLDDVIIEAGTLDPTLAAFANVSWSSGKIVFAMTAQDTFVGLSVGEASATSIIDRQTGDLRYRLQSAPLEDAAPLIHTHSAADITSGTLAPARLAGTYSEISVKLNAGNSIFGAPSLPNGDRARTVYNLVQFRGFSPATVTGAIVFSAPNTTSTIMSQFHLRGMLYGGTLGAGIVDTVVQGYATTNYATAQLFCNHRGSVRPMIRFGKDNLGRNCVIIGDVTSVWSYPHFAIVEALFSHNGVDDPYCIGWTSAVSTDLSLFTVLTTDLTTTNGGDKSYAALAASVPFMGITSTPITIDGYGITNAYTKTEVDTALSGKQANLGFTPENVANKGLANGYASLGSDGKVPPAQITFNVAEAATYLPGV